MSIYYEFVYYILTVFERPLQEFYLYVYMYICINICIHIYLKKIIEYRALLQ